MPVAIAALHLYLAAPEVALGGALRRQLAAAGAGVRLLLLLPHHLRRCCGSRGSRRAGSRSRDATRLAVAWVVAGLASRPSCSATARFTRRTDSSAAPSRSSTTAPISPGLWSASPDSLLWGGSLRTRRRLGVRTVSGTHGRAPPCVACAGLAIVPPERRCQPRSDAALCSTSSDGGPDVDACRSVRDRRSSATADRHSGPVCAC